MSLDSHDGEVTSTTTGLDMDSLLDDADLSTEGSSRTSHLESGEVHSIRRQLESLEGMYSEVITHQLIKFSSIIILNVFKLVICLCLFIVFFRF